MVWDLKQKSIMSWTWLNLDTNETEKCRQCLWRAMIQKMDTQQEGESMEAILYWD